MNEYILSEFQTLDHSEAFSNSKDHHYCCKTCEKYFISTALLPSASARASRIDFIRYSQLEDAIGEAAGLESSGHKRAAKETQRAVIFLEDMLANGPVEHTIIKQKAAEAGISLPTLNRAKKQCGMTSKRLSRESSVWR